LTAPEIAIEEHLLGNPLLELPLQGISGLEYSYPVRTGRVRDTQIGLGLAGTPSRGLSWRVGGGRWAQGPGVVGSAMTDDDERRFEKEQLLDRARLLQETALILNSYHNYEAARLASLAALQIHRDLSDKNDLPGYRQLVALSTPPLAQD